MIEMNKVEYIELVTEVGESYIFSGKESFITLNDITEQGMLFDGSYGTKKEVGKAKIKVSSNQNTNEEFSELIEEDNILYINLIKNGKNIESYIVKWEDGDIDENSKQSSYIDINGDLVVNIK